GAVDWQRPLTARRHSSNCHATVAARPHEFHQTRALLGICILVFLFMRVLLVFFFLLCSVPASFAVQRCDAQVPVQRAELGELSLVYQSVGAPSDPALLLVMGLGGQLIHWPDDVVEALCRQGFRVIRYDNRD